MFFEFGSSALNILPKSVWENQNDLGPNRFPNTFNVSHGGPKPFPKARANVKGISRHVVKDLSLLVLVNIYFWVSKPLY